MHKVILDVEGGQKVAGYREAAAWTRAHPDLAYAHYALSFALRWGGLYKEAAQECDIALKLDSANSRFHSCSLVFILLGRYDRARMYIDLDSLSVMERYRRMDLAILTNDKTTALETIRAVRLGPRDYPDARLMEAALSGASPETVQERSREAEALYDRISLPEAYFVDARHQSWAGQTEAALRLLRRAIATGYCSFPVMDSDPMLANARRLPEYAKLRQEGVACRESFQSQMKIR